MKKLVLTFLFLAIIANVSNAKITGKSKICDDIGYLSTDCMTTEVLPMEYKNKEVAIEKAKANKKEETINNYITQTTKESEEKGEIVVTTLMEWE